MFSIDGYQTTEQLYESNHSLVFRAIRKTDGLAVIFKVLKDIHPSVSKIARFEREYEIVEALQDLSGVVAAYDLVHATNHWVFIQEDFGGRSIAEHGISGHIELAEYLVTAAEIAGHLTAIHERAVIHKDVNPTNIVINRRSATVKFIDFGIATRLSGESTAFAHPSLVEGTPAYLSPEQTGRTGQSLDHRTDLYSLGCTLYELLTGRPPFEGRDLVEYIHCHLVRVPDPVRALRPDAPAVLEDIIDKLLAKNTSERYQSAAGVQADLLRCLESLNSRGSIDPFTPCAQDVAHEPMPPSRLYGREDAIARLTESFDRVANGAAELLLIDGGAGIGKSSLVKELYTPVTRRHGLFVAGKFDQFQRSTPYRPIIAMMEDLIAHVLMEPPHRVQQWAASLRTAAGIMLPVLADLLPRFDLLFECLPPPPSLPTEEFGFRLPRSLAACIRAFASKAHPLVLFIDDLQWADSSSLELFEILATEGNPTHLMLVGAHRNDDTAAIQSLRNVLVGVHKAEFPVQHLHLHALETTDTIALIADMLRRTPASLQHAGALIHNKTGGNPFFIQAFMATLLSTGVLSLDHSAQCWQIDEDRLRLLDSSDNVVDLLIADMRRLPAPTQDILACAACIGNQFDLELLAAVRGQPVNEVDRALRPALQDNHIIPINAGARSHDEQGFDYKFAHDRVQQAAHILPGPSSHAQTHLRIGRAMHDQLDGATSSPRLLATASQFNRALELVDDEAERHAVASLNNLAGRHAMKSVAHATALDYFEHGIAYLGGEHSAFAHDHRLAMSLYEGAAGAAYLDADFPRTEAHLVTLQGHARGHLDGVEATLIRINALVAQNQLRLAIDVARGFLAPLGVVLPAEPTAGDVDAMFRAAADALADRAPQSLIDLPQMTDPEPLAALRIIGSVFIGAFMAEPTTAVLMAAHSVLLTLRHGLTGESARGFIFFGMALCGHGQVKLGYEYGCLSESLIERRHLTNLVPTLAGIGFGYVLHWHRPLRHAVPKMRDAYAIGLESGQIEQGINCLQGSTAVAFLAGCPLAQIDREYTDSTLTLMRHKQGPYLTWLRVYHQTVRNLRGASPDPLRLQGDVYDEVTELPVHEETGDLTAVYMVGFNKMLLCYHLHEYSKSIEYADQIKAGNQPGSLWLVLSNMYRGLAALATIVDSSTAEDRNAVIEEARPLVEKMKQWGTASPTNYQHKYHLMAAELCRVSGEVMEAWEHYDRAADLARRNEFVQEEGLAFERAALFHLERGSPRVASYYMNDAYYAFERWGATAKLGVLRRKHGDLLEDGRNQRNRPTALAERELTASTGLGDLDLATVLAASRAITGEKDIDAVLSAVMRVSLENAGAERGYLLLAREDRLLIKVRSELGQDARFESISRPLDDEPGLAHSVVHYVARTTEPVVLHDAAEEGAFTQDPYIKSTACKSVLCLPILNGGRLIAISYLENTKARSVFDEDRLDVLALLMGQAAISVENALLRASRNATNFHFQVGGSLPADAPTYVQREADEQLVRNIRRGEFSYVFNTRQMGKSSLRVRSVNGLRAEGFACVSVDLSGIGSHGTTAEQWYAGIARALIMGLGLRQRIDVRSWWRERDELAPVQRLDVLLDEEILALIEDPIAIFIDEIDATLALDFSADDFFALIRLFYNRRAEDPRYRRLSVVLLGVANPSELIRDNRVTPFNVGRALSLSGFRLSEATNLAQGLDHIGDGHRLLRAVLEWTGGQPFLTQKICQLAAEEDSRPDGGNEREWVANIVRTRVIEEWRLHDEPRHLSTIESRVLQGTNDTGAMLRRYLEVLKNSEVESDDSSIDTSLLLSGIVTRTFNTLRVSNPVYEAVFDRQWAETAMQEPSADAMRRSPEPKRRPIHGDGS